MIQIMDRNEERLLGRWTSEPGNPGSEDVALGFKEGGQLVYTIHTIETDQIMILTYHVEGYDLVTDQPSHPREERTQFVLTDDGGLILIYGGQRSSYRRLSVKEPGTA
jgi:hypothetical protein